MTLIQSLRTRYVTFEKAFGDGDWFTVLTQYIVEDGHDPNSRIYIYTHYTPKNLRLDAQNDGLENVTPF